MKTSQFVRRANLIPPPWLTDDPLIDIEFLLGLHGDAIKACAVVADVVKPWIYRKSKAQAYIRLDRVYRMLQQLNREQQEKDADERFRLEELQDKRRALVIKLMKSLVAGGVPHTEEQSIKLCLAGIDSDTPLDTDGFITAWIESGDIEYRSLLDLAVKYADAQASEAYRKLSWGTMNLWYDRAHAIATFAKGFK